MKLCRFLDPKGHPRVGLLHKVSSLLDLSAAGAGSLASLLEWEDLPARLRGWRRKKLPRYPLDQVRLLPPVERQEVWAAGVTYRRSRQARMEESDFSANAYDRVYDAARPELFFKSMPEKVVGSGEAVGIRQDARWSVPEPELALVINSHGRIAGYTIGNDMSSRDIEGENLLYLPQAKIYTGSCALGPFVRVGVSEAEARGWTVTLEIRRLLGSVRRAAGRGTRAACAPPPARACAPRIVCKGQTSIANIKRSFDELAGYLFRSQTFPGGAVLLTGTGIVPGQEFSLQAGDSVRITISGIGALENEVMTV
jgi:2-dehydro-3-deoxy-D-arabinonate dehydratase